MGTVSTPTPIAPGVHWVRLGRTALASNVYLVDRGPGVDDAGWVLVDAGWPGSAEAVRRAAATVYGDRSRPVGIVLTHIHPDHSGAAGKLARAWRVPVYAHPDELVMAPGRHVPEYTMPLDRWVVVPLMRLLPHRVRTRLEAAGDITDVVRPLEPGGRVPPLAHWQWVPAPGHTPGQVAFLRPADSVVLSGDAVLTVDLNSVAGLLMRRRRVAGPPRYTTWDRPLAGRSAAAVAALHPRVLGPGHGDPLAGDAAASLVAWASRPQRPPGGWLRPLADAGGGAYRPPPRWYSRLQWIGIALTRLGLTPADVVTLEVPGRSTGAVRRTTLLLTRHAGDAYLVSLTGEAAWVRNVRAAGGDAELARRGSRLRARLTEVDAAHRAPILRAYVLRGRRRPGSSRVAADAGAYFGVGPQVELSELAAVADRFPVFRVTSR